MMGRPGYTSANQLPQSLRRFWGRHVDDACAECVGRKTREKHPMTGHPRRLLEARSDNHTYLVALADLERADGGVDPASRSVEFRNILGYGRVYVAMIDRRWELEDLTDADLEGL